MNADDVRRGWAERQTEYSPGYYAYYGPNETSELVRRTLDRLVGQGAAVLELGCSSGRHLAHLHDRGFSDLHGIDVNDDAFDVMAAEYPELADSGTFHHAAIEDAVPGFDDGRFDAVFSVETLQHVHADAAWVFEDVARIAGGALLTVECEAPVEGRRAEETPGDGSDEDGAPAGGDGKPAGEGEGPVDEDATDHAVNYVNGEIPLYYREWGEIFTGLGLEQVEARSVGRDTLRAFRPG